MCIIFAGTDISPQRLDFGLLNFEYVVNQPHQKNDKLSSSQAEKMANLLPISPVNESCLHVQGSPKECFPGLVNFVTAVAYHFCLNLPRAFSQPGKHSFGDPCTMSNAHLGKKKLPRISAGRYEKINTQVYLACADPILIYWINYSALMEYGCNSCTVCTC